MKKLFIIALLTLTFYSLSAQYTWINPSPQGNTLNDIFMLDENYIFAAGEHGTVISSVDGGNNWTILSTDLSKDLHSIYFTSLDNGIAVGDSGTILKTGNAGQSWERILSGTTKNIYSVTFTDNIHGICCGESGLILRTENGGLSWDSVYSDINSVFYDIGFTSADTGFVAGGNWDYGFVLKTVDGGLSWSLITDSIAQCLYALECGPGNKIYTGGQHTLLMKSSDGGVSWDTINNPDSQWPYHIADIYFLNENVGYFCSTGGLYAKTINGGLDWTISELGYDRTINSIDGFEGQVLFAGISGKIWFEDLEAHLSSLGKGPTWNLHSIDKTDHDHLFVTGNNVLIKSKDAGVSWEIDTIPELEYSIAAQFLDSLTGYALLGWNVTKTTDGGKSWVEQSFRAKADFLNGIHMIDINTGYVYGGGYSPGGAHWGTLIKTDDGTNWNNVYCPGVYPISECYFLNTNKGFASNFNGQMYMTTDAGNSWSSISLPISGLRAINDMIFIGDDLAYAVGDKGQNGNVIFKSINGGDEWKLSYEDNLSAYDFQLRAVNFLDSLNGYAVGTNGGMLETHDGGSSWIRMHRFTHNTLNAVMPVGESSGYLVGSNGCLVSFGEPGLGIPDITSSEYLKLQTYPNPFREKISFELYSNEEEKVLIEIHDLSGKLVYTDQKEINNGNQTVTLSPNSKLKDGFYILSIKGDKTCYSCKIIKSRP